MFEQLASPKTPARARRMRLSLSLAFLTQAAVAGFLVLNSVYTMPLLTPPRIMVAPFLRGMPAVHLPPSSQSVHKVIIVKREEIKSGDKGLTAPSTIPDNSGKGKTTEANGPTSPDTGPGNTNGIEGGVNGLVPGGIFGPGSGLFPSRKDIPRIIRNAGEIKAPRLLHKVTPTYPPAASAMGLTGRVVVELVINEYGRVERARVLTSSNPIFENAALSAVRKWTFSRPTDRAGQVVACYLTVVVSFRLR